MREVLFRGKSIDNNSWEYGYYFISECRHYIQWALKNDKMTWCQVHEETVSQFTGLLDKNGKRIFEGDILKLTYDGHSFNCEVKYSDGGFLVYENNGFNSGDADMTLIGWLKHDDYRYEVIGNIHDYPNLLK